MVRRHTPPWRSPAAPRMADRALGVRTTTAKGRLQRSRNGFARGERCVRARSVLRRARHEVHRPIDAAPAGVGALSDSLAASAPRRLACASAFHASFSRASPGARRPALTPVKPVNQTFGSGDSPSTSRSSRVALSLPASAENAPQGPGCAPRGAPGDPRAAPRERHAITPRNAILPGETQRASRGVSVRGSFVNPGAPSFRGGNWLPA